MYIMVKRHHKVNGKYHIGGHAYEHLEGSRAQVMHNTAYKTSGGLTKSHLMFNKHGRIVSRKKHATAKKEKRLEKHGYFTRKGHFGHVKKGKRSRKHARKSRHKKRHARRSRHKSKRHSYGHACRNSKGRYKHC